MHFLSLLFLSSPTLLNWPLLPALFVIRGLYFNPGRGFPRLLDDLKEATCASVEEEDQAESLKELQENMTKAGGKFSIFAQLTPPNIWVCPTVT